MKPKILKKGKSSNTSIETVFGDLIINSKHPWSCAGPLAKNWMSTTEARTQWSCLTSIFSISVESYYRGISKNPYCGSGLSPTWTSPPGQVNSQKCFVLHESYTAFRSIVTPPRSSANAALGRCGFHIVANDNAPPEKNVYLCLWCVRRGIPHDVLL